MWSRTDLGKLRTLSVREWRVLLLALVLLPAIGFVLRFGGLARTRRAIDALVRPVRGEAMPPSQIARLVSVAARRGPLRARCLAQSLTLQGLLHRSGASGELRIGVRKVGDRFEAHAWVEHGGTPLVHPADTHGQFVAFDPLPREAP